MDSINVAAAQNDSAPTEPQPVRASQDVDRSRDTAIIHRRTPISSRVPPELAWPRIPGYDILGVIGTGGMGVVYKARHKDLRRTVAIKTLRAIALNDEEFRVRFYAEAEAVARLQHPNIIQIFEIGTVDPLTDDSLPSPFIALEFVDGGSLAQKIDKPQPPQEAARMVEKLARGVHAAHQLGVIHRDLKPANVLLSATGEPKVADFGLAKQLGNETEAGRRYVTQAGLVLGTPEYMAPEQVTGAPATPAIDIYALGVVLYQMLTARVPFQGADPAETMLLVHQQEPVPPRFLQPCLPRDLETICLKCLEKKPERRYHSAHELADDLRRFLEDRPIQARRVHDMEKLARWCKRNPAVGGSLAGVVGVFFIAFALVTWSYWNAEAARQDEAFQRREAQKKGEAERWERYRANMVASIGALQVYNVGNARQMLEAAPPEFRDWEWRHYQTRLDLACYVWQGQEQTPEGRILANGDYAVLYGHDGWLNTWDIRNRRSVARVQTVPQWRDPLVSPDATRLAHRGEDNVIVLRDITTDTVVAELRGHRERIHSLVFSSDSAHLTTCCNEGVCCLWDARTGRLVRRVERAFPKWHTAVMTQIGSIMVSCPLADHTCHLWDLERAEPFATLPAHDAHAFHIGISPQGDRIVTAEDYPTCTMRLWTRAGRLLAVMRGHTNTIPTIVFSPDGKRIASGSRDQSVRLWDGHTGRPIATIKDHLGWVNRLAFSPDSKRLASGSHDQTVRLWDADTGDAIAVLHGHTGNVLDLAYTDAGATLVSLARDGSVRYWDVRSVENHGRLRGHRSFVYGVAFHPDGEQLASASWDGTARLWNASSSQETAQFKYEDKTLVTSVAFDPTGKLLAVRARGFLRLLDVATRREVRRWDLPIDLWRDTRVVFNRAGDRVATGCASRVVRVWDVHSGAEVATFSGHRDQIRDLAFSPDGRWLASSSDNEDPVIRIWDLATKEPIHVLRGHILSVYTIACNPSGTLLASGGADGTLRLWNTATWSEVSKVKLGINLYSVAFSPDGKRLACACADNCIRLYDVATHQEVAELRGHSAYVHQIAFSPDGTRLVSASGDHTLRVWDTLSAQERQEKATGKR